MSSAGSITKLIVQVKAGNAEAWERLYQRMIRRVIGLARKRLWLRAHALGDADDVAAMTLASFFRGIQAGKHQRLQNRDDLWHLLAVIVTRRACDLVSQNGPPLLPGDHLAEAADPALRVDLAVLGDMEVQRLLGMLNDDREREIAIRKMEGYSNEEIAEMLNCACRTVERKLHNIRQKWQKEIAS